jgi:Fur family ferric uptake transcriptional regulator
MQHIHLQEKEQFKKLFEQEEIDNLEDRIKILEVFLQTERHISEQEFIKITKQHVESLSPEFIRNTLDLLCLYGFASKLTFENGEVRYEHRHMGQHHDHMICTKCNKIIEFENDQLEKIQLKVASMYGFHMLQHRMEIYGICSNCLKKRLDTIPLTAAKQGERLIIRQFIGGAQSKMRLLSMGLRMGDKIDVITNFNKGQLVIALDYNRLVLGRGLAEKIIVQPAE